GVNDRVTDSWTFHSATSKQFSSDSAEQAVAVGPAWTYRRWQAPRAGTQERALRARMLQWNFEVSGCLRRRRRGGNADRVGNAECGCLKLSSLHSQIIRSGRIEASRAHFSLDCGRQKSGLSQ